jgi:hypothetical protein
MNAKHAIAALNVTAAQAINDALQRRQLDPEMPKPTRVFLGEHAYGLLHDEAEAAGMPAVRHPRFEDDRLEYKGMKVHCHRLASIEFE